MSMSDKAYVHNVSLRDIRIRDLILFYTYAICVLHGFACSHVVFKTYVALRSMARAISTVTWMLLRRSSEASLAACRAIHHSSSTSESNEES